MLGIPLIAALTRPAQLPCHAITSTVPMDGKASTVINRQPADHLSLYAYMGEVQR